MNIAGAINNDNNIVTLQQAGTTTQPIDLGGAGSGTRLALTDAELDEVTAGILRIGRTDIAVRLPALVANAAYLPAVSIEAHRTA